MEEWKPTYLFPKTYEISSLGNVRSVTRKVVCKDGKVKIYKGKPISIHNSEDYNQVTLQEGGRRRKALLHKLIAVAFIEPPVGAEWIDENFWLSGLKLEVCHFDNDSRNNTISNLRWDSRSGNQLDRLKHGTHNNAIKTKCPFGHDLKEPNLVPSSLRNGIRKCQACARARGWCKLHPEDDFESIANLCFLHNASPSYLNNVV